MPDSQQLKCQFESGGSVKIPHVACKTHTLNLKVNEMVKQMREVEAALNSIQTMSQCKNLKNVALLHNLVSLVPVIHNKMRCSVKL